MVKILIEVPYNSLAVAKHFRKKLLYKVLLPRQFICRPDFPQDIEKGLDEDLIVGLRRYRNSPQVNQLLTPQITDEVKDSVIENVTIFFEDVHEFHI